MANYNSMPSSGSISYPLSTYSNARNMTYSQVGARAGQHPNVFPGQHTQKRGGGGRNMPKIYKQFSCENHHPIQALKTIRPNATFEMACSYNTAAGAAVVYTTNVDGVVYQGEGTSGSIAKAIAATKALAGINAVNSHLVKQVADYEEQKKLVLERIQAWQEMEKGKEEKKRAAAAKIEEKKAQAEERKKAAAAKIEEKKALAEERKKAAAARIEEKKLQAEQKRIAGEAKQAEIKAKAALAKEEKRKLAALKQEEIKVAAALEREKKKAAKENEQILKKQKGNMGEAMEAKGEPLKDWGRLKQLYGPDVVEEFKESAERDISGGHIFEFTLTIQGFPFQASYTSKRGARNMAVAKAFEAFEANPPPVVNTFEKKRKTPKGANSSGAGFQPIEAVLFQDKLAEKCWHFVTEKTTGLVGAHNTRRNLAVIVKVKGAENAENLDNCEIVAFGNGTLLIHPENMNSDGTVINDSTGESLALRALRRYLLDQIELAMKNKPSVYVKDRSNKYSIVEGTAFYMYTNSSPMGDCRAVNYGDKQKTAADTPAPTVNTPAPTVDTPTESTTAVGADGQTPMDVDKPRTWRRRGKIRIPETPKEDLGKITYTRKLKDGYSEIPSIFSDDVACHPIPSPSDKLALRQMCGVQGSILFNFSNPVYISKYLIGRSFNEESLKRALYDRVKDAPARITTAVEPQFQHVKWRASRLVERRSSWSYLWTQGHSVELIASSEGKQLSQCDGFSELLDVNKAKVNGRLAMSEYCTKALYTALSSVCASNKKPFAPKYSVTKTANTRYRTQKNIVIKHLKDTGMGIWIENPVKPEF